MNLNQLWSGSDYAYFEMRGRGEVYRTDAKRVRIIRVYQERQYGNQRLSGFAEVKFLNDDGTPKMMRRWNNDTASYEEVPKEDKVRARDIAMHWEEYWDEREHRIAEREKIERQREEAVERENAKKAALLDAIVERFSIPREVVTSIDDYTVRINRAGLEKELELNG